VIFLKILIVTTGYPRWDNDICGVYIHRTAKKIVEMGNTIDVLTPYYPGTSMYEEKNNVHIYRFKYFIGDNLQTLAYLPGIPEKIKTFKGKILLPFLCLFYIINLLKLNRNNNYDIINCHFLIPTGFLVVLLNKLLRKKVITTVYGAEMFPVINGKYVYLSKFLSYTISKSNYVVGISDASINAARFFYSKKNMKIIPDGIDVEKFNSSVNSTKLSEKYSSYSNIIFTSGRFVERKGFIYLIKAMPLILKEKPDTLLIIGGDGPDYEKLNKLVLKLNISNNVKFLGFIADEEFPNYMKFADIFVLPSIIDRNGDTEGSGTILLEAMSSGTPVVGTNVGGIPYALKDGVGGFLINSNDSEAISNSILRLLNDEKLYNTMKNSAIEYVKKNFSNSIIASKYVNLFKELIYDKI